MSALPIVVDKPETALRASIFAHGYQPIAIYNWNATNLPASQRGKKPYGYEWQNKVGTPTYNAAALNTGILTKNLRAIDIDLEDDRAGIAHAIVEQELGCTPLVRKRANSPRRLLVFRGAGDKINIVDETGARQIEILGRGQQFVAYGRHSSGAELEWEDEQPDSFPHDELPEASEDAIARLAAALCAEFGFRIAGRDKGEAPEPEPAQAPSAALAAPSSAATEAWATTAFDEETKRVATCGRGGRNEALNRAAYSLGQIVGGGYLQETEVVSALRNAALACGLVKEDGWPSVNATIRSGLTSGRLKPREKPEREIEVDPVVVSISEAMAGAKSKRTAPPALSVDMGKAADWAQPTGLLREMTEWILATSPMPNRPLAVAAATAVVSTVCGRHLYSASGTSMNLYIAMLAKTGYGKDRPLSAPGEILSASGLKSLRQSGKSFAVSGFESMIVEHPCCLAIIDELGANLMSRISHKRSSTHEQAIKPLLLELWSRTMGKDAFMTTHRAQSGSVAVHSPSLTILGASTPEKFYATLQNADAADGFMNRFLIAEAAPRSDEDEDVEREPVSQLVTDCLQGIVPHLGGNLGGLLGVFSPNADIPERKLEWGAGARDAVRAFKKQVNEIVTETRYGDLWGRTYEYAIRLGGIHAVSRAGANASLEIGDMQWGAAWAVASARAMTDAAENLMARSNYEADLNEVKKEIREAGVVTRSALLRAIRHIKSQDLENITNHLAEAGMIEKQDSTPDTGGKGGRPIRSYRWKG